MKKKFLSLKKKIVSLKKKIKKKLRKKFGKKTEEFVKPTFLQKLKALWVQILMLPVSCLIQLFSGLTFLYIVYLIFVWCVGGYNDQVALLIIGTIIYVLFDYGMGFLVAFPYAKIMAKIKSASFFGGSSSERIGTVSYDIKDSYGTKIGTYETAGTVYDYEESRDQNWARVRAELALPLRVISIVAAFIG